MMENRARLLQSPKLYVVFRILMSKGMFADNASEYTDYDLRGGNS